MRRIVQLAILCLTLPAACGDDGLSNGGNLPLPDLSNGLASGDLAVAPDLYYPPEQACAEATAALCKRLDECAPALLKLAYGDAAACNARLGIHCTSVFTLPGTSASPLHTHRCSAALGAASCDDLANNKLPADCVPLPGMLQSGAACADDAQCASAACVHPVGGGCGTCGTPPRAGESCARLACATGLVCGAGNAICAPYGKLNDACDPNHPCLPSLSCKGSNKQGSCIVPLAPGAGCDPLAAEYAGCDLSHGQYCAPGPRTCQPLTFAQPGGACGLVNNNYVVCAASGHCTSPNIFITGTCLAAAHDGAACDTTKGPDCTPPAVCSGGICKITDPASCK